MYKAGARVFWVHNIGPIGCSPFTVIYGESKTTKLDKYGCIKSQNEVAKEFNKQLKDRVSNLRTKLVHSAFTYVDVYSAKYSVISKAKKLGKLATRKLDKPIILLGEKTTQTFSDLEPLFFVAQSSTGLSPGNCFYGNLI